MKRSEILIYRIIFIAASFLLFGIIALWTPYTAVPAALRLTDDESYINQHPARPQRIVYIDAGHGGVDYGAVIAGVAEKEITLAVSLMVYEMLMESGIVFPVLSRSTDVFINRYARAAEGSLLADMIVSIHCNSFPEGPSVRGLEVYYDPRQWLDPDNRLDITGGELANIMQRNILSVTGAVDRGARSIHDFGMELVLTTAPTVPSVLVEMGYLTNPAERALLASADYQRSMARGIYYGILEAFERQMISGR